MAYGNIKADKLVYDNNGSDTEININTLGPARTDAEIDGRITAATGVSVQGFDANNAVTDTAQTFTAGQRGAVTTLTGTSPAPNLNDSNNFTITTSGTTAFGLPSGLAVGQSGSIFIVYGGAHGLSFNSAYKFVGGSAGITPTSTSGAIDRIDYIVQNASSGYECLTCNFTANYVS